MTKIKGKKLKPYHLKSQIIKLLKKKSSKAYTAKQIIKKLKIDNSKGEVTNQLAGLVKKNLVLQSPSGRYRWMPKQPNRAKAVRKLVGHLDIIRSGAAYLVSEQSQDDVYIPQRRLKSGLDGDLVEVEVLYSAGKRRKEGRVTKVLERSKTKFVAKLIQNGQTPIAQLGPEGRFFDVRLQDQNLTNVDVGTPLIVHVTKWQFDGAGHLFGKLLHILDASDHNETAMLSILLDKGFDVAFPDEVLAEAEKLSEEITPTEQAKRRDMRDILTFTVDPDDAKDFDDAISYRTLDNERYEIGVHIADVSHFVRPGTPLDREAYHRSTSVYLVDRVCPMLPERLSNELCSLRPNEDKYCFSAVFHFDKKDKIIKRWFGKTLIHSDRRLSYEEAQEIIENGTDDFAKAIKKVNALSKKLQKERFQNGSIAFETEEVKFKLDENAVPVEAYTKTRVDAHMMIEDLMLLANREVAEFMAKKANGSIPFVYRVHDTPDPDKVAELALFAKVFDIKLDISSPKTIAKSFNKLVKKAEKDQSLKLLVPLAIRTMAKAVYTTENIGHYGLAFNYYTHFTSPIRRYADVLVHRILFANLKTTKASDREKLETKCHHISSRERKAMEAERASIKYKQVEFMSKHIGELFDGIISGLIDMGVFVEILPSLSEGMIRFDRFDEQFVLTEGRLKAVSNEGRELHIGQKIKVRVLDANLELRQIELGPVE